MRTTIFFYLIEWIGLDHKDTKGDRIKVQRGQGIVLGSFDVKTKEVKVQNW